MKMKKEEIVNLTKYMDRFLRNTLSLSKDEEFLDACLTDEMKEEQNNSFITSNLELCMLHLRLKKLGLNAELRIVDLELSMLFLRWRIERTGRRILNFEINMETLKKARQSKARMRRRGLC